MINEDYITEDYVSYEVAKLLKDKGFNIECNTAYYNGRLIDYTMYGFCGVLDFIFAPTHQMAMKWLREKHDLHIIAYPYKADNDKKWCCQVFRTYNLLGYEQYTDETLDSYEEAVEAALKYVLENLI